MVARPELQASCEGLARTTKPVSAERQRLPDVLEGRAGPVRASVCPFLFLHGSRFVSVSRHRASAAPNRERSSPCLAALGSVVRGFLNSRHRAAAALQTGKERTWSARRRLRCAGEPSKVFRSRTARQKTGGRIQIDVGNQQPFLPVGLVAQQRSIGRDDGRGGRRVRSWQSSPSRNSRCSPRRGTGRPFHGRSSPGRRKWRPRSRPVRLHESADETPPARRAARPIGLSPDSGSPHGRWLCRT